MKIVIPDDHQNTIHKHDAFNLDELAERLRPVECVVEVRERVDFSRALIEQLSNLKLIARVGSRSQAIDYAARPSAE